MKASPIKFKFIATLGLAFLALQGATFAESPDSLIKERKVYGKVLRTRMPPQVMIETIQKEFTAQSPKWRTFWQNFVIEDDEDKDEFVIIARSMERKWAFGLSNTGCTPPDNYEQLKNDISNGGTPVRMDAIIGVKRKRSFFRYTVTVYQPMYEHWKNPCFVWNLAPGTSKDAFYKENYNMQVYAENLVKDIYEVAKRYDGWKSPKNLQKIPAIRGAGYEYIGGEADTLTDEEKQLPMDQQEKLLEKRRKKK